MSDIELDYDYLKQKALRHLVADVLSITAEYGDAPGEHHFYIEFVTQAPGVILPDHLKEAYPDRMTIVLQHQFENLIVDPDQFSVSLWFRGKRADLVIPFDAISSFADPSVQFGLSFELALPETTANEPAPPPLVEAPQEDSPEPAKEDDTKGDAAQSADVVSLDSFRKK